MSIRFDGSKAQYLEVENPSSFDWDWRQPFSVAAWVWVTTPLPNGAVVSKAHRTPTAGVGWALNTVAYNGPVISFHMVNESQSLVAYSAAKIQVAGWTHIAATQDGTAKLGGVKLYIDGSPVAQRSDSKDTLSSASIRNSDPVRVAATTAPEFWTGAISHVFLDDRVVPAQEISALASLANLSRSPSSFLSQAPQLYLPLTTVDDLADQSGWGNDAKIVGPTTFGEPE